MLSELLAQKLVLIHPLVLGELAMGNLPDRAATIRDLHDLPRSVAATLDEALHLVDRHALFATGIGYGDATLLTSAKLTPGALLWTRDKRLRAAAAALSLDAKLTH